MSIIFRISAKCMTLFIIVLMILFSGCTLPNSADNFNKSEQIKEQVQSANKKTVIGFICPSLINSWYQEVQNGIKTYCIDNQLEYRGIDCEQRDDLVLKAVNDLIEFGAKGIIISITNEGLGPIIAEKCESANVALLALDKRFKNMDGINVPYIGKDPVQCAIMMADILEEKAIEKDFFAASSDVKIVTTNFASNYIINRMVEEFNSEMRNRFPKIKDMDFLFVESADESFEAQRQAIDKAFNKNTIVTHWIAISFNNEGASAFIDIFQKKGITFNNVLVCGVGGSEVINDVYQKGGLSAESLYTIYINPNDEGMTAAKIMQGFIENGIKIPDISQMKMQIVSFNNYQSVLKDLSK